MAAELITLPFRPVINTQGVLEPGARLDVFQAGTTTRVSVFSDAALTAPLPNPVVASASGVFPTVYFDNAAAVRVRVRTADGSTIGDADPYLSDGLSSTDIGFQQSGTGAVTRTTQDKLRDTVSLKDFGAVGNNVADDTAAINAFLAAVAAGAQGFIPAGNYRFTAPLNAVSAHNVSIIGPGYLVYGGASTNPGQLMTFGDGTNLYQYLDLRFGGIGSSVALTGGWAIRVRRFVGVKLDMIVNGPVGFQGNLWQGVWFDNTSTIDLGVSQFYTSAKNVMWNNGSELHCASAQIYGKLVDGQGSGIGIHIAGGCGGFYLEDVNQLYNDIGVLIDTSVSAVGNEQMFFDTGALDSNKTAAVFVNDSVSNPLSKTIHFGCWAASSSSGGGLTVGNWRDGKIHITTAKLINHSGSGVFLNDATVRVQVSNAARISNNNVGIDSGLAVTIFGDPQPYNNTAANFGTSVTVAGVRQGLQTITQDPANDWMLSGIPNTKTIANGANLRVATGSGLIVVTNPVNGENAIYNVGGSGVSLVDTNGTTFVAPTTTPAAGRVSVAWNGSNGYNIYNNFGSSQAFTIAPLLKMRATV